MMIFKKFWLSYWRNLSCKFFSNFFEIAYNNINLVLMPLLRKRKENLFRLSTEKENPTLF